jgi:hypothetical protein
MAGISGITVASLSNNENDFFTTRKNFGMWKMYKFNNDKEIQCCLSGDGWGTLLGYLPSTDVRYVIANFTYVSPIDNIERVKRVFLMWAPENARVKDKLKITMYSREAQKLLGRGASFHVLIQGNELSDVDSDRVLEKIQTTSTVF